MINKLLTYITGETKYEKIDNTEFFRCYQKINGKVYEYTFIPRIAWISIYNGSNSLDRGSLLLKSTSKGGLFLDLFSTKIYAKKAEIVDGIIINAIYEDIENLLYSMKLITTFQIELLSTKDFIKCYRNILSLEITKKCPIYMTFDIKDEEKLSKIQNIDTKIFKVSKDGMKSEISTDKEILNIYFEVTCNNIKTLEFYHNSINNIIQIIQKRIEKI